MFDVSWHELFLIAAVTVIVVGPKEIPRVLRTVTGYMRKIRGMAREFQNSIDEMAREADLDDLKRTIQSTEDTDLQGKVASMIDPTGETTEAMKDLKDTVEKPVLDPVGGSDTGDGVDEAVDGGVTPDKIAEAYETTKAPPHSLTPPVHSEPPPSGDAKTEEPDPEPQNKSAAS